MYLLGGDPTEIRRRLLRRKLRVHQASSSGTMGIGSIPPYVVLNLFHHLYFSNCAIRELRIKWEMLKPQDILVTLKLLVVNDVVSEHSFSSIAEALAMSASETHAAVKRATRCHLLSPIARSGSRRGGLPQVATSHLLRFVENGLPYVFPAKTGPIARGMVTGIGAEPLRDELVVGRDELIPVWPIDIGPGLVRGISLEPIYRSCPQAARNDPRLHRLLSLVDAIRDKGIRQQQLAYRLFEREVRDIARSPHRLAMTR